MTHLARVPRHLLARLSSLPPLALAALGAGLLLLLLAVERIEARSAWSAPLPRGELAARGFELGPDGTLRGVASPDDFHVVESLIDFGRLGTLRDYDVRFDVLDSAPANVVLRVDFFAAPGYDGREQERARLIGVESVGTRVSLRINSGWAPRQAYLRLFYFGPPGLTLGEIHFRPTPVWSSALGGLRWVGWGLLLLAGWLAIVRRAHPDAPRSEGSGVAPHPAWALAALYLAAVLAHAALHLFAPLWRGDDVQYKAVATAFWWLGADAPLEPQRFGFPIALPGRLYPYLIAPALAARAEFYAVLRLLNALLMCAVVFPTYAIGRRYLSPSAALLIAALSAALPFVNLSAYAMTEVAFFPLYVTAAWLTLESLQQPSKLSWPIGVGCAAALALATRPSGSVVLPAFALCHVWAAARRGGLAELVRRPRWLAAFAVFAPVFLALQWLTGVEAIVSSGFYAPALAQPASALGSALAQPAGLLDLGLGHLATLAIPFALPLALLPGGAARRAPHEGADAGLPCIVAAVFFLALFALALLFTVMVAGSDVGGLGRWHSRYYFPAYPLLMLAFAALLAAPGASTARRGPWVALGVGLLLGAHLWFVEGRTASRSVWFGALVDNMDVHWYALSSVLRWLLLAASALLAWLWYRDSRWLRPASIALAALWIGVANLGTARTMGIGERIAPDPCGQLAASFLELRPGTFAIVGVDARFREAASFWSPYLPSFSGPVAAASRYLSDPSAASLDFIVTDAGAAPDPRFELRVDAGTCRIYERR